MTVKRPWDYKEVTWSTEGVADLDKYFETLPPDEFLSQKSLPCFRLRRFSEVQGNMEELRRLPKPTLLQSVKAFEQPD